MEPRQNTASTALRALFELFASVSTYSATKMSGLVQCWYHMNVIDASNCSGWVKGLIKRGHLVACMEDTEGNWSSPLVPISSCIISMSKAWMLITWAPIAAMSHLNFGSLGGLSQKTCRGPGSSKPWCKHLDVYRQVSSYVGSYRTEQLGEQTGDVHGQSLFFFCID